MGNKTKKIKESMESFLIWWAEELASMIPKSLSRLFTRREKTARIFFSEKQTTISLPTDSAEKEKICNIPFPDILEAPEFKTLLTEEVHHPVTITLSDKLILERQITLPKAAKNNFRNIVKLQLPRLLPMAEPDILFDCQAMEEEDMITVSVAMITRQTSQKIGAVIIGAGLRIKTIKGLSHHKKEQPFTFLNLSKKYKLVESRITTGLLAGLLLLSILFTGLHYAQLSKREAFLAGKMTELSQGARGIEALSSEIQSFNRQQGLYQSKIDHIRLDQILSALTDLLPDDSWIFDFALNGNRLTISGKTSNASLLVEKIDNNPLFTNVTNSSSRIGNAVNNQARERFSISFELMEKSQ